MRRIALLLGFLLMAGCASGPTVTTNVAPGTDLAAFSTFNFMLPMGTDRPGGVRTPLSNMLIDAASRELELRGLALDGEPDLLVNFWVVTEDRLDVRTVPTMQTSRNRWGRRYSTWPAYETTVREYTRGTLVVDVIEKETRSLVWEGSAQQRVSSSDTQLTQERVDELIGAIMKEFRP